MPENDNTISRRKFIELSAAATAGLVLTACAGRRDTLIAPSGSGSDLVLMNGKIITVDPKDSIVQAVAARDGIITKVGTSEEIQNLIERKTNVIDLKGKTVTPGLVDSHIHVLPFGKQIWEGFTEIRYPYIRTKEELLQTVEEKARTLRKGEWISGNQGFLLTLSNTPDRWELDAVAPNNPVYLRHMGGQ